MEKYAELISILLQHSQRFMDFWNFQIIVSLAVLGFVFSNGELMSRRRMKILVSLVFVFIAAYSVFSLSVHQQREVGLWTALEARVSAEPAQFTAEEIAYLDSLKPTDFKIKAGALLLANLAVIGAVWLSPKIEVRSS
jgi:hypothetical protein